MDGPGQTSASAAPAGNSSDFVRKLYKMLEDPSYSSIVRWGDEGDSFVVLECEKFTKTILPKHFKHSNFASFVRQLNKYDFHKVRQNNEESGQSPYGQNAWEFKHPEFRANSKDSLDNIRRKAPAPRKQTQATDESGPTQQIDLLNQQILAQQQQIQHLSDRFTQLSVDHQLMYQESLRFQKTIVNHESVIQQVMSYLLSVDARQKREGKGSVSLPAQGDSTLSPQQPRSGDDVLSSSPLQQASKLLNDMNAATQQFNMSGTDPTNDPQRPGAASVATSTMDATSRNGSIRPTTTTANAALVYPRMGGDLEQVVYPVGATNGIDPMYTEHFPNVPYPMPSKTELDAAEARRHQPDNRKKSTNVDPGWVRSPRILLVEDDSTCRQIGGKFLVSFSCVIDTAYDGLEAVNKVSTGGPGYDLILMDIIMPNLDGVSACHLIRQNDQTPIIAMTSNIRSDDIQLYYQHGMNGVLPKPFTRKSLLEMLEQHLAHLKAVPPGIEAPSAPVAVTMAPQTSASQSIKEDSSPGQSPAGSIAWQSPGQFQGMQPVPSNMTPVQGQYVAATGAPTAYAVDQNGVQFPAPAVAVPSTGPPVRPPHRRQISEMSSVGENPNMAKRQRMYAQPQPMMAVQAGRPG